MTDAKPLRAGMIGLGMMGRNHLRVLGQLEGVQLVGAADLLADASAVSVPLFRSHEELIDKGLDIAVVATPTEDHEKVGIALAQAGIHALIEKPIASDLAAGERLVEAFESAGLIGCVGHIERFNPGLRSLRQRVQQGEIGEIHQIATRRIGPFPGRIRDVGVVKDLGTHDLDLTAWVAGSNFSRISAQTAFKSGREFEDLLAATGRLQNGVITNHLVNWLSPVKERSVAVTGEKGALVADMLLADVTLFENGEVDTSWDTVARFRGVSEGNVTRYAIAKPEPLLTEHAQFRDAVLGLDNAEVVTLRDGLEAIRVAEACIASSASGQTVVLP